jgi:hypothetical protein
MESVVDTSAAVCRLAGTKRAASPVPPVVSSSMLELHQPHPQHDYPHPTDHNCCKRQQVSLQPMSIETKNACSAVAKSPSSIIWHDFRDRVSENACDACDPDHTAASNLGGTISNMEARTRIPFSSTQDRNLGSALTAGRQSRQEQSPVRLLPQNEDMDSSTEWGTETNECKANLQQRGLCHCSERQTGEDRKIHNFYTKASILTPRGIVDFQRVQVDERSSFNLLPWSIAIDLELIMYSDRALRTTVASRPVYTNQYCRFNIRIGGVERTINTGVVPGLYTILLGREWIQSVSLLNGSGEQSYYIPIPLVIEMVDEKTFHAVDAKSNSKHTELGDLALYEDDEYDDFEYDDNTASDDELSLDASPLSNSDLSCSELTFDGKRSLNGSNSSAIFEGEGFGTNKNEEGYERGEDERPSDRDVGLENESI